MANTYKYVPNRKLVMSRPEGADLKTASDEMSKIIDSGDKLAEIARNMNTSRQNIFDQKKKGFMTPHTAISAEKCGMYGVKKENLRPDVTEEQWRILEESLS